MNKSYMSNFGLEFLTDKFFFASAHSLDQELTEEMKEIIRNSHIYCIVDSPRVMIDPQSFKYRIIENFLFFTLKIKYRINEKIIEKTLITDIPYQLPEGVVKVEISDYPHIGINLLDSKNNITYNTTVYDLAYKFQIEDLISMKVLYIGKAIGNNSNRNALDRLRNHSTFQKILADRNAYYPDRAVFIGMFKFHQVKQYTIIDAWDLSKIDDDDDLNRIFKANKAKISLEEQIAIIEMALIRYFEPEYNNKLKKDLPKQKSKILAICEKYDFSGIAINFCIDNIKLNGLNYYFYTEKIQKNFEHLIRIELIDPEVRKGFFSIGNLSWAPEGTIRRNKKN
ncbi:hypothetical protein ABH305_10135 [Acinetobacter pittii]|uniref:hypothetical protein n=1 Tax=Acinetobacter calcoaceticus/baumannii complex TaxID=909768 RepID=UPI0021D1BC7C|nr:MULTISPECIES: hypothetical protein [Acinetobacter calcoaceticus/baumannii complex]EKT8144813.1 hypothetical protein [Acinetobacter baumannii]EKU7083132.1 hypothetical protein [Acinetobacter baumannii]EKV1040570.1 hypothetical protein [Acinetobacter baumannii]EKV1044299.1 hypothetical protein [Acinetobacter baumannii]EKV1917759.1 hypothetical protein [Acinetobacter baumannii]